MLRIRAGRTGITASSNGGDDEAHRKESITDMRPTTSLISDDGDPQIAVTASRRAGRSSVARGRATTGGRAAPIYATNLSGLKFVQIARQTTGAQQRVIRAAGRGGGTTGNIAAVL